jgi:fluoride exporter
MTEPEHAPDVVRRVDSLPAGAMPVDSMPVDSMPVDPDVEPQERLPPLRLADVLQAGRGVVVERWDVLALISLGGALGSLARWWTSVVWPSGDARFPWATLQVNVLGAALIGLLMVLVRRHGTEGRYARPFLGAGVLGGYTTFSTYTLDVHGLLLQHRPLLAGAYLLASLLLGLLAVWLGVTIGRLLFHAGDRHGRMRG